MKLIKRLIVLVVVLVLLVVGAVVFLYSQKNSIFKAAIEKGGTYAMGVETKLTSAELKPLTGTATISGLTVANPPGYKSDKFFGLGSSTVQVRPETISQPVIELPILTMSDIRVNLEKSDGKANYKIILDNLARLSGSGKSNPKPSSSNEKKFVINEVDIRKVVVHVDLIPVGGQLTQVDVPIDEVTLKNVGTAGKGLPAGELAAVIVKAVLSVAAEKGVGVIPGDVLSDLQSQLAQLGNLQELGIQVESKLGDAAQKAVGDIKKEADKQLEDAKKKAEDKLKELIPGKK